MASHRLSGPDDKQGTRLPVVCLLILALLVLAGCGLADKEKRAAKAAEEGRLNRPLNSLSRSSTINEA